MTPIKCPFDCYYDAAKKSYLICDNSSNWIEQSEQSIVRRLKAAGISRCKDAQGLTLIDRVLLKIQDDYSVVYTGPLAGWQRGLALIGGNKILVTSQARHIIDHKGDWSTHEAFLKGLLTNEHYDQLPTYYSWIKVADLSFVTGLRRPGQALVMAGPRSCGKSLDQKILTEIFGGRSGKPYGFMMGQTMFNRELFGAEHQMIEDEVASQDLRIRRNFGAFIKGMVANEVMGCHGKHRESISLSPLWRLTISVNDEPENLSILPPLDESLADKVILLRAYAKPMPMPTATLEEMSKFWHQLVKELPAFLYFIRREWEIPKDLQCERYGVKHYHHPELVSAIRDLSPQFKLLKLIDSCLLSPERPVWSGSAEALERELIKNDGSAYTAKKLLYFNNACGTYLGHLAKDFPGRVTFDGRHANQRVWKITVDPDRNACETVAHINSTPAI
jgi:hypothetical protein